MVLSGGILGARQSQYAYAYGLACSLEAKLLKAKDFNEFASARGISEIVATLEGTPYEKDLQGAVGKTLDAAKIESALSSHFERASGEVLSCIPKRDRLELKELLNSERDLRNLKTVVRGIAFDAETGEVLELLESFGNFKKEFLVELANGKSLGKVAEKLKGMQYYNAVFAGISEFEKSHKLSHLETIMDLEYLQRLEALEKKTKNKEVRDYIRMQNEALILRNLKRGQNQRDFLLKLSGYYLSRENIERLLMGAAPESVLAKTPYSALSKSPAPEMEIERIIITALKEAATRKPLSIATIICFIKEKEHEAKNLRALIIGKANGLDAQTIKGLLI